ncbi:MAG TPA: DUF4097 family beta strand repeat-containing protein [Candidatus Eisenbacteria bacterium]
MTLLLPAVVLATSMFTIHTDTTVVVKPGARLSVENFGGSVKVSAWTRNAVHIEADHSSHSFVELEGSEDALRISTSGRRGPPSAIDFRISMPKWMDLRVSGVYTDMSVEGTEGEVRAQTVKGDLSVVGGRGFVTLQSVQGGVSARGTRGRVELSSVNETVEAADVQGDVRAEAVNGDVVLSGINSAMVEASTVNGDICYRGSIAKDGHYHFSTHSGDIDIGLPDDASAAVSVSTFSGEFETVFKARLFDTGGKRFNFTLGSGGADLGLETFQGTIRLRHAGDRCGAAEGDDGQVKHREKERVKTREKVKDAGTDSDPGGDE